MPLTNCLHLYLKNMSFWVVSSLLLYQCFFVSAKKLPWRNCLLFSLHMILPLHMERNATGGMEVMQSQDKIMPTHFIQVLPYAKLFVALELLQTLCSFLDCLHMSGTFLLILKKIKKCALICFLPFKPTI